MNAEWRADPWGRADYRWFDGEKWTERVSTNSHVFVDHPNGPAAPAGELAPPHTSPDPTSATPGPLVSGQSPSQSSWRRFRALPIAVQVIAWIGMTLSVPIVAGVVAGLVGFKPAPTAKASKQPAVTQPPSSQPAARPKPMVEPKATSPQTSASITPTTTTESISAAIANGNVAQCTNGTFSNNTDFAKTCSGNGGLKSWLAPYGKCSDNSVITMKNSASCDHHHGFAALLPSDYLPPTEAEMLASAIANGNVAQCTNGTFSNNTDFAKTCSGNGGLKSWLAPYGKCSDNSVITMKNSASCDHHHGFAALLPSDYLPPPSTTTSTTPPTTTLPTVELGPCPELQKHSNALVCAPTVYGPLWISAPFSQPDDQIALLPNQFTDGNSLQADDMGVAIAGFHQFASYGQRYWCLSVGLKNFASTEASYNMFDFQLLTPSGSLDAPTVPLANGLNVLLDTGALASDGSVSGTLCFNEPRVPTGRFAVVYKPLSFLSESRALFYFDR